MPVKIDELSLIVTPDLEYTWSVLEACDLDDTDHEFEPVEKVFKKILSLKELKKRAPSGTVV